ncbi:unnamed protein product [Arctia plantaginis]|uniref:Uncharacterized protein n=1 Tax=Arctia plantaginis TaxID=874455 RepID=A0A8S1BRK4_ARCPL|nr:unnamed protein product [Arctia plantaginis]
MVSRPLTTEEMRSLPARAVTMVLCAPDTAGPWSAHTITTSSKNLHAHSGSSRWNLHIPHILNPIPGRSIYI